MANTFELIAGYTVPSAQVSYTFTSIPSTFTDLVLKASIRNSSADTEKAIELRFNGSTSNYTTRTLYGTGSTAISFSTIYSYAGASVGNNATSNTFNNVEIYIPNYAGSTNKSFSVDNVCENNTTGAVAALVAGLWSDTSAITSIAIYDGSGANLMTNSTFYLYGVKNA